MNSRWTKGPLTWQHFQGKLQTFVAIWLFVYTRVLQVTDNELFWKPLPWWDFLRRISKSVLMEIGQRAANAHVHHGRSKQLLWTRASRWRTTTTFSGGKSWLPVHVLLGLGSFRVESPEIKIQLGHLSIWMHVVNPLLLICVAYCSLHACVRFY